MAHLLKMLQTRPNVQTGVIRQRVRGQTQTSPDILATGNVTDFSTNMAMLERNEYNWRTGRRSGKNYRYMFDHFHCSGHRASDYVLVNQSIISD